MAARTPSFMRIFWPSDAPRDEIPGVLVGWRNSDLDILVVGVLQGVDARSVRLALLTQTLFRGSPHVPEDILLRCGGRPIQVLGTLDTENGAKSSDPKLLSMRTGRKTKLPQIELPPGVNISTQIITFDRPDPKRMQYLSLAPIPLALGADEGSFNGGNAFDIIDKEEEVEKKRKSKLVEKLKLHTVVRHPRTPKEEALPTIIVQINCSAELNALMQKNIGLVGVRPKRVLSVSERVAVSASNLWESALLRTKRFFQSHIWPLVSKLFVFWLMMLRFVAEIVLTFLDWRPFDRAALKDISATAQQVDIRLQQFCYWPAQYVTLQRRRNDWESITNSHPEYIRFFNSLWLVANDVIMGIALGSYIIDNADAVAAQVDSILNTYSIQGLQRMLLWLMDNPAGLKLNSELAAFLGDLFLWVIDYWNGCVESIRPGLPYVIRLIGISSFAGASLPISLFSDLLSLLTVHIYSFYMASARIYSWQLSVIISLFHLFRGKKRNVLRNRIDNCDYDLDQLLIGTILFTLLIFLLPTVAVFYATFAGARIAIIALKAALDTWLACLNHFPLFALMLRIKDSRRLPGGIRFELQDTPRALTSSASSPVAYVKLKSIPLPLSQTFTQYAQLGHRLRKHYLSFRVFLCLLSGQFVPQIHRRNLYSLQYSMLPRQRVSIGELWQLLNRDEKSKLSHANGHAGSGINSGRRGSKLNKGYWWSQ